jgi:hypothetical protein
LTKWGLFVRIEPILNTVMGKSTLLLFSESCRSVKGGKEADGRYIPEWRA